MAKKSSTSAITPSVESKINLNVNQNDLVEMVVSEKLEALEIELIRLIDLYKSCSKREDKDKLYSQIPVPTELSEAMSVLYTTKQLESIKYEIKPVLHQKDRFHISIPSKQSLEEGGKLDNYGYEGILYSSISEIQCVAGRRSDIDCPYQATNIVKVTFPGKYVEKTLTKQILDKVNEEYIVLKQLDETYQLYKKTKRSAPMAKARLIRKALSGSTEGQAVLNIIDTSGIKLLS